MSATDQEMLELKGIIGEIKPQVDALKAERIQQEREVQEAARAYSQVEGHAHAIRNTFPIGDGPDALWEYLRGLDAFDRVELVHDFTGNQIVARRFKQVPSYFEVG